MSDEIECISFISPQLLEISVSAGSRLDFNQPASQPDPSMARHGMASLSSSTTNY